MVKGEVKYMDMVGMKKLNRQGFLIAGLHLVIILNIAAEFVLFANK